MPRLKAIEPIQAQGPLRALFDGPLKGAHFNVFKAMAASPDALRAATDADAALSHGPLAALDRIVIRLVIAQCFNSPYDLAHAHAAARSLGLDDATCVTIRRNQANDPRHAALARFARAVHDKRARVSDADVAAFRAAGFDDAALASVLAEIGLASAFCQFNLVNQTPPDSPLAPEV